MSCENLSDLSPLRFRSDNLISNQSNRLNTTLDSSQSSPNRLSSRRVYVNSLSSFCGYPSDDYLADHVSLESKKSFPIITPRSTKSHRGILKYINREPKFGAQCLYRYIQTDSDEGYGRSINHRLCSSCKHRFGRPNKKKIKFVIPTDLIHSKHTSNIKSVLGVSLHFRYELNFKPTWLTFFWEKNYFYNVNIKINSFWRFFLNFFSNSS